METRQMHKEISSYSYSRLCIKYCLALFLCVKLKVVITSLFLSIAFVLYFITWFYLYFVKGIQKTLLQGAVKLEEITKIFQLQK